MTAKLTKAINGNTRMLKVIHQVSWRDHIKNLELYGNLPKLSTKIQQRRMTFGGHCYQNSELVASQFVLMQSTNERKYRGRQRTTYLDILLKDTGLKTVDDLENCTIE